jgi:nucleosome binding factor SPN SPT16 subunit
MEKSSQDRDVSDHPSSSAESKEPQRHRPKMQEGSGWGDEKKCTSLVVPVGSASDELRYLKSIALQLYLFGYELPGTPTTPHF